MIKAWNDIPIRLAFSSINPGHQLASALNLAMTGLNSQFNLHQKQQLFEQGWVIVPQVVSPEMVRAARHAINSTIENYLDSIQVRAHELKTDACLTNMLTKTDAFSLIESALGNGKVVPSIQCWKSRKYKTVHCSSRILIERH